MANLHIQMSEEAETELQKRSARNKASSALASFLLLFFGSLILYLSIILITQPSEPEFITYTPPAEVAPPVQNPTVEDLTSKPSSPSHDIAPSVIVAVGAANVQMAQVDVNVSDSNMGSGFELGVGMGTGGLGDGIGSGGNGLGDGNKGGSALEGTFYDLKQTRNGSPMANSPNETARVINDFMKNWNEGSLSKYYQSPTKLYASNFCLPSCKAEYAPAAYQCKDKVQPSAWIAVYRGKVKAPFTGVMRFVGTGDDVLMVRFNNKTVLEAGWCIPSTYGQSGDVGTRGSMNNPEAQAYHKAIAEGRDSLHKGYEFITRPELGKWNRELGGLTAGEEIKVEAGKVYPIEVLISEIPGGAFGFVLLTQEKTEVGFDNNKFDLFRTNFSNPTKEELEKMINAEGCGMGAMEMPNFNADSPVWLAVP